MKRNRKNETESARFSFEAPWGNLIPDAEYFFAWERGIKVGTYNSLSQALETLIYGEHRLNPREKIRRRHSSLS
jgi:hypothetical protein